MDVLVSRCSPSDSPRRCQQPCSGTYLAHGISGVLLPGDPQTCRRIIQITVWAVPLAALSLGMSFALQAAGRHDEGSAAGSTRDGDQCRRNRPR
jgi:hypothetical protein